MASLLSRLFDSPFLIFAIALLLRVGLLFYGIYQDAHSALKYTDIDYYVFTDAARAVSRGASPYTRATYRYTPLLAWILLPTSWSGKDGLWFHSGKALFAVSDIVAGYLIYKLLQRQGMSGNKAMQYASAWLLNPMVANISTRGSSEGLLCALVIATLYAFETRQIILAGSLLGLAVHFKIYPFIYGVSMFWALKSTPSRSSNFADLRSIKTVINRLRLELLISSLATFMALNILMYSHYGKSFLQHTFFYHFTRTDHRHNFSVYNTLLYSSSAQPPTPDAHATLLSGLTAERLAFIPQILLSCVLLPLLPSTHYNLPTTLFAQTLAFVTFNKVCTSQYFLWYLVFLPLYLPHSSRLNSLSSSDTGTMALIRWIFGQAIWLAEGYRLEFHGASTFIPGLFGASILFFAVNCWLLGIVVEDGGILVREVLEPGKDWRGEKRKAAERRLNAAVAEQQRSRVRDEAPRADLVTDGHGMNAPLDNYLPMLQAMDAY
ncbi:GPI mannosyltransferase 1 [Neophaeococcomyces mojaviensis]|uniref:GPI mannosyltransferase 1 n=1 Tax=Neophaeococcomyces mojaviensis TaxID=3383035 RepID=A0ACC3A2M1_9EURO|nr:GPI mannosyltransferase 1 [Knufia sp. JES_112]